MAEKKDRSYITLSIYLRTLRVIFNNTIIEQEIEESTYPFGRKKYEIPSVKNVKKVLTKDQLKLLFDSSSNTPEQEKAKGFWYLSFACNGMSIKDIALLKYENLNNRKIEYFRAKTIRTKKET